MHLIKETDFGTPTPKVHEATRTVTLEIDGREITVSEGTSIMNAAMQLGIQIPKLCATDSLDPWGSCRLCLCEIEGRKGTPASCT
ncbi:MAG: 2Fe-2S iron-sulfur cluster-binding protein, partial [Hyphomicrobium sp.]